MLPAVWQINGRQYFSLYFYLSKFMFSAEKKYLNIII